MKLLVIVFLVVVGTLLLFQNFIRLGETQVSDEVILKSLEYTLALKQIRSLSDITLRDKDEIPLTLSKCASSNQATSKAFHKNPPLMKPYAEIFHGGIKRFERSPQHSAIVKSLRTHLELMANLIIADSIKLNSTQVAWTNLSSDWDAFANGTCTPKNTPNLYASANALIILSLAYEATLNPTLKSKILTTFTKGANFWMDSSLGILPQTYKVPVKKVVKTKNDILSFYKTKPANRIFKRFILGGQDTTLGIPTDSTFLSKKKLLPRPFRFFYTDQDPALVSLNCSALLGYSFLRMAMILKQDKILLPQFTIRLDDTSVITKDLYYVGFWTIYPVFYNLKKMNASYYDIDTIQHTDNTFEAHFSTITLPTLLLAGDLLRKSEYVDAAIDNIQYYSFEIDNINATGRRTTRCLASPMDLESSHVCSQELGLSPVVIKNPAILSSLLQAMR